MVLTGLGTATFDVAAQGDHPLNFYIWSGMGCTAMVGLGLALARPDRRVAVITGDGDVLMALGSLATIGAKQPKNLSVVCIDNAVYAATGMQPTATGAGCDLAATARSCGFKQVVAPTDIAEPIRYGRCCIMATGHCSYTPASARRSTSASSRRGTAMG